MNGDKLSKKASIFVFILVGTGTTFLSPYLFETEERFNIIKYNLSFPHYLSSPMPDNMSDISWKFFAIDAIIWAFVWRMAAALVFIPIRLTRFLISK